MIKDFNVDSENSTFHSEQQDTKNSKIALIGTTRHKIRNCLIPHEMYEEQRLVVGYSTIQEGQDIRDKDVVRPLNHRWCYQGQDETHTWSLKSRARCPTYGSCSYCLKSGPVNKFCNECMLRDAEPGYLARRPGFVILRYQNKLLDSIKLAEILNQGHETAKADQYFVRNMDKIVDINSSGLKIIAQ